MCLKNEIAYLLFKFIFLHTYCMSSKTLILKEEEEEEEKLF